MTNLHVSTSAIQWLGTAYMLITTIFIHNLNDFYDFSTFFPVPLIPSFWASIPERPALDTISSIKNMSSTIKSAKQAIIVRVRLNLSSPRKVSLLRVDRV
jgi:hypothetical protein